MTPEKPCIRGCVAARRHTPDCADTDTCPGCLPRPASNGRLCYPCHTRLRNLVQNAHGQWAFLLAVAGKSTEQVLTAETTARPNRNPRLSDGAPFPGPFAKAAPSASESEPVRIPALDAAQDIADWLSTAVELVVAEHQLTGPRRLRTGDPDGRRWKWHAVRADGTPAAQWEPVVVHSDEREQMAGQYVLHEPPVTFAVDTAAHYLLAWLDRFEDLEVVGDEMEAFSEVMSRAHSLAPWREQVARLRGIPCPACHATALVRFGGDECVTCLRCKETIGPARYAIWTRMLAEQHKGSA